MQIGALWTILYASLIDLLSFLKPFLEREGDFLAMAERLSAPFAAHLHSVTAPLLHGKLGESTSTPPSKRPKFYPMAWMCYSCHLVSQSSSDSFTPCLCYLWNAWKRWCLCSASEPPAGHMPSQEKHSNRDWVGSVEKYLSSGSGYVPMYLFNEHLTG